jgi:hypothetical protein
LLQATARFSSYDTCKELETHTAAPSFKIFEKLCMEDSQVH